MTESMTRSTPRHAKSEPVILQADGVTMQFGGLRALNDVSFGLAEGEIIGLIGPNGAGKTTLFNCLTGLYAPTSGAVSMRGKTLPQDPAKVTEQGVARTFQNIRLFPSMTAQENVLVGRHVRMRQSPLSSLLHGPGFRRSEAEAAERTESCWSSSGSRGSPTSWPATSLRRPAPAGDRPGAGHGPVGAAARRADRRNERAGDRGHPALIFSIRDLGISVVVIEHDTKFIFTLCDRVLVLVQGELLVEGSPDEVRGDPRVVEAYLGAPPDEVEAQLRPWRRRVVTSSRGPRSHRGLRGDPGGAGRVVLPGDAARSCR